VISDGKSFITLSIDMGQAFFLPEFNSSMSDVFQPGLAESLDDDPGNVLLDVHLHGNQRLQNRAKDSL